MAVEIITNGTGHLGKNNARNKLMNIYKLFLGFSLVLLISCKKTTHNNPYSNWIGEWELLHYNFDSTKIINKDSQVNYYEYQHAAIMNVQSNNYYKYNGDFKHSSNFNENHSFKYKITTHLTDTDSLIIDEKYEILDLVGKVEFSRHFVNGVRLKKDVDKYGRYWDSLERRESYHLELREGTIFYSDREGRNYLQYYYNDHYGWQRIFTKK